MSAIDTAELERLDDILRDPLSGLTWNNRIMAADALREVLARRKAEAWQPISSAPFHTPVIVKVGQMTFPAVLRGNAAMDENGQDCAQWQAMNEGEHPPCWSDGACWASNADGLTSMQPTCWKPATPEAEGGSDAE